MDELYRNNKQQIENLYDAQKQSQLSELESAYNQNLSNYEAAKTQTGRAYQASANDLAVQYERNRRNLNEQAAARGLNTGAASQQQLALNQQWQRNYGSLRAEEAATQAETERSIADLKAAYQLQVQQAISQNDYEKARALMDEYNNAYSREQDSYNRQLSQAQLLAQYGDFSGFASLYGEDQASQMAALWNAQNPELAYNTGRISAEDYRRMTGKWPSGYVTGGSRVNDNGNTSDDGGDDGKDTTVTPDVLSAYMDYLKRLRGGNLVNPSAHGGSLARNLDVVV